VDQTNQWFIFQIVALIEIYIYIVAVVAWSNPVAFTITTTSTYHHQAFEEKCHPKIINQPSV
jgi:hypothetical protein